MKEKKMKNWVIVRPRKKKEWIICILMLATIVFTVSPVINLLNTGGILLGMPSIMTISLIALVIVLIVVNLAYKWEVH